MCHNRDGRYKLSRNETTNKSVTPKLLDVSYTYLPVGSLSIQTETNRWCGRTYTSDYVRVLETDSIGFEFFDNEIIIFFIFKTMRSIAKAMPRIT